MRKKLDFATFTFPNFSKISLDLEQAKKVLDLIYMKRHDYIKTLGNDPKGIVLPARLYIVLVHHFNDLHRVMGIDPERKLTLFGLEIHPTCGSEFSFIPDKNDLYRIVTLEEI